MHLDFRQIGVSAYFTQIGRLVRASSPGHGLFRSPERTAGTDKGTMDGRPTRTTLLHALCEKDKVFGLTKAYFVINILINKSGWDDNPPGYKEVRTATRTKTLNGEPCGPPGALVKIYRAPDGEVCQECSEPHSKTYAQNLRFVRISHRHKASPAI